MVGIVGYGAYVPSYRIKVEEIAKVWGDDPVALSNGLVVNEKSVPSADEDTATIAVTAARYALARAQIDPQKIGAVTPDLTAADLEFACKAGTAGIQMSMGLVESDMIEYGLAIGADTSQGAPGDALEYTASAGGAAYIIGKKDVLAEIKTTYSFTTDTPDFYRREGEDYPSHGGRFTGEPAYFKHVLSAAKKLFEKTDTQASDYDYACFHQPNGKFYLRAAKKLGFTPEQYSKGLLTPNIGNTYSGAVPLGLSNILDVAEPGDKIFVVSYGSGAGSDGFTLEVTDEILKKRDLAPKTEEIISKKTYVDYAVYAKFKGKIKM